MRNLTRLITTAVASMALALGVGLSPAAAITATEYDAQVISDVNVHRAANLKPTLATSACLNDYAQAWSRTLAAKQQLVHRSSTSLRSILSACGLRGVGENLAAGYGTGHAAVSAWMRSTGHRANILKSTYRLTAVGVTQDSKGRWWAVQLFGNR